MAVKKKLGDAFFKHIASPRAPSLFKKFMRSLDSGQYHVPKSFDVMSRFPSDELKLHHAPPLCVMLPENELLKKLHRRYPETRHEPVELSSMQPPVARRFVWRQMQLMQRPALGGPAQAVNAQQAFVKVEQEMQRDLDSLKRRANLVTSGHVALLQAEEELQLKAALDAVAGKGKANQR